MGSSRPTDRSLGEATFLPQWMKGKLETRFDYSDSTFSPPADDTFFFIRYPKHQESAADISSAAGVSSNNKEGFRSINEVLSNKSETLSSQTSVNDPKNIDFSKHPVACQPFIPLAEKVNEPKVIIANKPKVKHQTNENDFHNVQAAECGRSIVHVAHQIMSTKFGKSNSAEVASSSGQQQINESVVQTQQQQRRGSKSLPATPLASPNGTPDSSPKSRRRVYGNRFFTGAFIPNENHKNGWLLSSILNSSREIIAPKIVEEDEQVEQIPARALSRKKSISSQNLTYLTKDEKSEKSQGVIRAQIMQAKPSELREMNFWSPTSM